MKKSLTPLLEPKPSKTPNLMFQKPKPPKTRTETKHELGVIDYIWGRQSVGPLRDQWALKIFK